MKRHHYEVAVEWTGNDGTGTKTYQGYRRDHTISVAGKPPIPASSDRAFRGDPSRYSPEDMLVAALSSCHMLWYLHLCSANQITVVEYRDAASGEMDETPNGSGAFAEVTLRPIVIIAEADRIEKARALHENAHTFCFIAKSVNFPVLLEPTIRTDETK